MFAERNDSMLTRVDGRIFVDRDPAIFKYVVSYLRNNQKLPLIHDSFVASLFEKELDFWGLPPDYNQKTLLKRLFETPPRKVSKEAFKRWLKLGSFDIEKLKINENCKVVGELGQTDCANKKYDFWCQTDEAGYLEGIGRYCFHNDELQEGQFECGKLDGQSRVIYGDGSYYLGTMENGQMNGHGVLTCSQGEKKEGWWDHNAFEEYS